MTTHSALPDLLAASAARRPHQPAVAMPGGRGLTYAALATATDRLRD